MVRLLLVGIVAGLILLAIKNMVEGQGGQSLIGQPLKLPELSIDTGQIEEILGTASEKILGEKKEEGETAPIAEPVEKIQSQTEELIESVKKLPEDQIKAIKEQIYQEFCEGLLEGE